MDKSSQTSNALPLHASTDQATERAGVTRRVALQGLAAGLGGSFALPLVSEGHPVQQHVAERSSKTTPSKRSEPEFLDAHQFATLSVLAELIVPGAVATESDRFIDSALAVEAPSAQQEFLTALGAVDGFAISRHQRPFKDVGEAEQVALLEEAFTQPSGRPAPKAWQKGDPVAPSSPPERPIRTLRDHVDHIKGWVAGAHYSSEAGMKELGWTGNMFFQSYPGCTHPDGHKSVE
jgi:hypothetical protein